MHRLYSPTILTLILCAQVSRIAAHIAIWHPSMWGFNVTDQTFPYDNRPVTPLVNLTFDKWWFHGHLNYPPNPGDIFDLPAGGVAKAELACHKGITSYWESSGGPDVSQGESPCPSPTNTTAAYHTTGFDDLKGCALAIAYKSEVTDVKPEDFAVFSVNHTCVWTRDTDFPVPERMPPCPDGGCICAWFWIHSQHSGGEQNYMNGFKCNVTGSTSTVAVAPPQIPRRCGADPEHGVTQATPGNCTYGAKQPFYWFQAEDNNMHEDTYGPPFYTDLYNFNDGAQEDIFLDSYASIPPPSPDQTVIPTPAVLPLSTANSIPSPTANSQPVPTSSNLPPALEPPSGQSSRICRLSNSNTLTIQRRDSLPLPHFIRNRLKRDSRSFSLWNPIPI